jgi:glycosyltransferase, family 2
MPEISVIVPVYNGERWLRRCIDSILAQSYTDFELLLIDDGSTDSSGVICDRYATQDSRIRVFHKTNGGVSSARNVGLDNSRGEWIAFADADDYVAPEWLQNYLVDDNSDKAIICQGLVKFIQKSNNIEDIEFIQEYKGAKNGGVCDVLSVIFQKGMLGWLHIKAFNGKLLRNRKTRFDINQRYCEDQKFLFDFLNAEDNLIMYDVIGYFYQVAETDKYADWRCTPQFAQSTVNNIKRLGFESGCFLRNCFVNEYMIALLKYYKSGLEDRAQIFRNIASLMREESANIGLFRPMKALLRYERTGIISRIALRLFLALKPSI